MYNQTWKHDFSVETYQKLSMREACATLFEAFAPYEQGWGADLCTQSAEVLRPVVEKLVGMRAKSMELPVSILREYVSYCLRKGFPGACDGMLHVEPTGLDKLRSKTVRNPLHLQRYLDQICDPESEETSDNTIRLYCWMAYSGVPEEAIFSLTPDNIALGSMLVHVDGRSYPLYRESLPGVRNCMSLTQFVLQRPYQGVERRTYLDRVPGRELIRGIRSLPSLDSMRSILSRRTKQMMEDGKTDARLTYYGIWLSGVFYRVYEQELAGIPPEFETLAGRRMDGKEYSLGGRNTVNGRRRRLSGEYMTDYIRWKSTLLQ